jgi:hypothetical protein
MSFLFVIYSCKKNEEKSNLLYNIINNRIPNCKCFILNGEPGLERDYKIVDDKYLLVKCGDYYENLSEKSICLFRAVKSAFPNVKGIFKVDDDIIPNINKINEMISLINSVEIDYLGNDCTIPHKFYSKDHFNKCSNPKYNTKKIVISGRYITGPLYYVSMKSIKALANSMVDYNYYFFEDNMVGYFLRMNNIYPYAYKTYHDNLDYINNTIQNIRFKILYIRLQGGLSEQLFQVSAAYEIAKKYHMVLILLYGRFDKNATEWCKTIFNKFNSIPYESLNRNKLIVYNEEGYNPNIITQNSNYLLEGYFQDKNYINPTEAIQLYKNKEISIRLMKKYNVLTQSYFIYVSSYHDNHEYYKNAIEAILKYDSTAHFYILGNDIEIFENIHKTLVEELDVLDSLYFMSLCLKGGICGNNKISEWGGILNRNNKKMLFTPAKN